MRRPVTVSLTLMLSVAALAAMPLATHDDAEARPASAGATVRFPSTLNADDVGPGKILVLGDSYSAGNGAGSYFGPRGCRRSTQNYGYRLSAYLAADSIETTVKVAACSGATTKNLLVAQGDRPPQIDSVNRSYDLILLTFGGNDADFGGLVRNCLVGATDDAVDCEGSLDSAENLLYSGVMTESLTAALERIAQDASTSARIALLGYPFLEGNTGLVLTGQQGGEDLTVQVGARLRKLQIAADKSGRTAVIRATKKYPGKLTFVSTQKLFKGPPFHGLYKERTNPHRWMVQPGLDASPASYDTYYHPNIQGWDQEGSLLSENPWVRSALDADGGSSDLECLDASQSGSGPQVDTSTRYLGFSQNCHYAIGYDSMSEPYAVRVSDGSIKPLPPHVEASVLGIANDGTVALLSGLTGVAQTLRWGSNRAESIDPRSAANSGYSNTALSANGRTQFASYSSESASAGLVTRTTKLVKYDLDKRLTSTVHTWRTTYDPHAGGTNAGEEILLFVDRVSETGAVAYGYACEPRAPLTIDRSGCPPDFNLQPVRIDLRDGSLTSLAYGSLVGARATISGISADGSVVAIQKVTDEVETWIDGPGSSDFKILVGNGHNCSAPWPSGEWDDGSGPLSGDGSFVMCSDRSANGDQRLYRINVEDAATVELSAGGYFDSHPLERDYIIRYVSFDGTFILFAGARSSLQYYRWTQ